MRNGADEEARIGSGLAGPGVGNALFDWLGMEGESGPFGRRLSWWALPRRREPRIYVPRLPAGWDAALELLGHSLRRSLLCKALPWMARVGWGAALGSRRESCLLDEWVRGEFGCGAPVYAVYLGTPSVFVKDTVQCQDERGNVLAYVKVPRGPKAGEAVEHEDRVLRGLAGLVDTGHWPRSLGMRNGASMQSAPKRSDGGRGLPDSRAAAGVSRMICNGMGQRDLEWSASPVAAQIHRAAEAHETRGDGASAQLLRKAEGLLAERFWKDPVPHYFSHGDFVPWNMRGAEHPFVFDWEWAGWRLPFHDAYQFILLPRLKDGRRGGAVELLGRDPEGKAFAEQLAALVGADPCDPVWLLSYLAERFAFYGKSAWANGDDPRGFPAIRRLRDALEGVVAGIAPPRRDAGNMQRDFAAGPRKKK